MTLLALLAVPIELLRARIAGRYIHPASGRVYNLSYNPPRVPGRDDVTDEPLVQRPDDTPEVYERRLRRYDAETAPLVGYYSAQAEEIDSSLIKTPARGLRMVSLAGETSDAIWPQLERTVQELFPAVLTREEISATAKPVAAQAQMHGMLARRRSLMSKLGVGGIVESVKDLAKSAMQQNMSPK